MREGIWPVKDSLQSHGHNNSSAEHSGDLLCPTGSNRGSACLQSGSSSAGSSGDFRVGGMHNSNASVGTQASIGQGSCHRVGRSVFARGSGMLGLGRGAG